MDSLDFTRLHFPLCELPAIEFIMIMISFLKILRFNIIFQYLKTMFQVEKNIQILKIYIYEEMWK